MRFTSVLVSLGCCSSAPPSNRRKGRPAASWQAAQEERRCCSQESCKWGQRACRQKRKPAFLVNIRLIWLCLHPNFPRSRLIVMKLKNKLYCAKTLTVFLCPNISSMGLPLSDFCFGQITCQFVGFRADIYPNFKKKPRINLGTVIYLGAVSREEHTFFTTTACSCSTKLINVPMAIKPHSAFLLALVFASAPFTPHPIVVNRNLGLKKRKGLISRKYWADSFHEPLESLEAPDMERKQPDHCNRNKISHLSCS